MSGTITLALRTAQSGLLVNQQALGAISDNIANVNSPGYSRKIVNIEQRVVGGSGAGVQLSELTRVIDEGLVKSLRLETGTYQRLRSQQSYYERIQETSARPTTTPRSAISHTFAPPSKPSRCRPTRRGAQRIRPPGRGSLAEAPGHERDHPGTAGAGRRRDRRRRQGSQQPDGQDRRPQRQDHPQQDGVQRRQRPARSA